MLAALLLLDRLRRWRTRAEAATADLSGRTPRLLLDGLERNPMAAVPQLAAETGASRPALQRNLAILEARGLAREVTGQAGSRSGPRNGEGTEKCVGQIASKSSSSGVRPGGSSSRLSLGYPRDA